MVTVMVPIHGRLAALEDKLESLIRCDYPQGALDILVLADGPVEGAEGLVARFQADHQAEFRLLEGPHSGKNVGLVRGAKAARGAILMVTDADATMDPQSISAMVAALEPDQVGGGCGLHVITSKGLQSAYWGSESRFKEAEMTLMGSITASNGTILAVKRERFPDLPPFVTDDLFMALAVVQAGYRFVYAPGAIVHIQQPSRHPGWEFRRRRRIVCRSLWGLWIHRGLFNPLRHGLYAICLGSQKLLRRLLPLFLLATLLLSAMLAWGGAALGLLLLLVQVGAYGIGALGWWLLLRGIRPPGPIRAAGYFLAANVGLALGILDFLRGRQVASW
ncbi:MAG: glycosyltransferase [Gammaproteobacteria bacterium]|nr:MAG: glycosyltransferase [Gammaproteobacteria bacterium]